MSDSWDERRQAQEDAYFDRLNKEALARLARKQEGPTRASPATGKPMQSLVLMGVVIDVCVDSGGAWLDSGELEQLLHASKLSKASLEDFIRNLPALRPAHVALADGQLSPITGRPLHQERCPGGIWLDARDLDHLLATSHTTLASSMLDFFSMVIGRK